MPMICRDWATDGGQTGPFRAGGQPFFSSCCKPWLGWAPGQGGRIARRSVIVTAQRSINIAIIAAGVFLLVVIAWPDLLAWRLP